MIGLAKFSTFSPGTSFDAWMGQITRNVALNATRKRKRIGSMLTETGNVPEPSASVRPVSDGQAEPDGNTGVNIGALTEALAGLDDVPRSCLLLRVVGGLPYQAIAAILQIPESTAMSHVFRSRGYLRRRLADRAVPPRATATVQVTAAAKAPDETGVQR
jgi:RNA polymerase sigma factor (sigma-70 family)